MKRLQGIKKLAIALVVAFSAMALIIPATSLATSVNSPDKPGTSAGSVKDAKKDTLVIGKDMLSAGQSIDLNNPEVYANLFAAGNSVKLSGGKIAADVFAAGDRVEIDQAMVGNNVFAAGNSVTCNASAAGQVLLAGNSVRLDGQAAYASAAGNSVFVSGSFSGDVNVSGDSVTIGPDTVIDGTLYVQSPSEPTIPSTAKIANYKYTHGTSSSAVAGGFAAAMMGFLMMFVIAGIVGIFVFALLALLLATDRPFVAAGNALRARPARVLLTGFVVILLVPIVVVLLFITLIGWELALTLLLACGVLSMISNAFAAISVGFMVFKKMNRWGAAMLMTLIFGVVGAIPIVGWLLSLFCSMFIVGYVCTCYFDWRRGRKVQNRNETPVLGATQSTPQGAAQGGVYSAPQGAPQGAAQGAPQSGAHSVPQGTAQGVPQDGVQSTPQGAPQDGYSGSVPPSA